MSGQGAYQKEKKKNPELFDKAVEVVNQYISGRSIIGAYSKRKKPHLKWDQEKASVLKLICKSERTAIAAMENPASVAAALMEAGAMGLTLYPTLGYGYLAPETLGDREHIVLVVGYKGFENLALRSKTVKQITTDLVYSNDVFRRGTKANGETWVEFEMARGDRGTLEGGFCRAILANESIHVEWMDVKEIDGCEQAAIRKQGRKPLSWAGAFRQEMQKKCVVRRAAKHWVVDTDFAHILDKLDQLDPMDFDTKTEVPQPEERLVLTQEHRMAIITRLEQLDVDANKASQWIDRQAEAWGFKGGSSELYDDRWEEAQAALVNRAEMIIKARREATP